jgi:hypothetical protein
MAGGLRQSDDPDKISGICGYSLAPVVAKMMPSTFGGRNTGIMSYVSTTTTLYLLGGTNVDISKTD